MNRYDWLKLALQAILYVLLPSLAKSRDLNTGSQLQLDLDLQNVGSEKLEPTLKTRKTSRSRTKK